MSKISGLGILQLSTYLFITFSCSSYGESEEHKKDKTISTPIQEDTTVTLSDSDSDTEISESKLNIEMTDLERLVLEADEEGIYLVQTEEGFDYIKADINGDGHEDVAALVTFEPNPGNYDFDTEVQIAIYTGFENKYFSQYAYSNNVGGESIRYKDFKKLNWANGILTYTHQSMKNYINIDIKSIGIKTQIIDRVSICYTSQDGCEDVYLASNQDTIDIYSLNREFLDSIMQ